MIIAASTQRSIGLTLFVLVALFAIGYVLYNVLFAGRDEIGAEIELAPNRKPYLDDADLETKKLDKSLLAGVVGLAIIALALPLYWLGEPGRQEGFAELTDAQFASRGGQLFEAQCAQCHGADGVGGLAPYTVADEDGRFIAATSWKAPALNTIFYRFSEEEVLWILNFGRPQSPMPAWGLPGGGPLTSQQLEEIMTYLGRIQLEPDDMQADVLAGVRAAAFERAVEESDEVAALVESLVEAEEAGDVEAITALREEQQTAVDDFIAELSLADRGQLYYENAAAQGAYNCARCHTAGWSWDSDVLVEGNGDLGRLILPQVPGSGGYGPSLFNVATQFPTAAAQSDFVGLGCQEGASYGTNGVCDGGGQMPGFGDGATDLAGAVLTPEQIDAVVAYERSLGQ